MKLRQLPISGDWIDPSTITRVRVHEAWHVADLTSPPRVSIKTEDASLSIDCESMGQAQAIRDEIAGWANEENE